MFNWRLKKYTYIKYGGSVGKIRTKIAAKFICEFHPNKYSYTMEEKMSNNFAGICSQKSSRYLNKAVQIANTKLIN